MKKLEKFGQLTAQQIFEGQNKNEKALTLTLSHREREQIAGEPANRAIALEGKS